MFACIYTVTNQFSCIHNRLQKFDCAFGDASEMMFILDEPLLVDDLPGAPVLAASKGR